MLDFFLKIKQFDMYICMQKKKKKKKGCKAKEQGNCMNLHNSQRLKLELGK
jgi:hypothetical protein